MAVVFINSVVIMRRMVFVLMVAQEMVKITLAFAVPVAMHLAPM
jgi:hypothetical protein